MHGPVSANEHQALIQFTIGVPVPTASPVQGCCCNVAHSSTQKNGYQRVDWWSLCLHTRCAMLFCCVTACKEKRAVPCSVAEHCWKVSQLHSTVNKASKRRGNSFPVFWPPGIQQNMPCVACFGWLCPRPACNVSLGFHQVI